MYTIIEGYKICGVIDLLEKDTNQLIHSLKKAADFKVVRNEQQDYLISEDIKIHLTELLILKNKSKADVLRRAEITEATGYQYFDGKRKPSREKMIALAIGLELTLEETDLLMKKTSYAKLYPKHEWDAVIIYGMTHQLSIQQLDELLFEEKLNTFL